MTEHFLYITQICSIFYQMCRKTVTERMWCDIFFHPCFFCILLLFFPFKRASLASPRYL